MLPHRVDAGTAKHASVYVGQAGLAVFFLRLARARAGDAPRAAHKALLRARAALDAADAARHAPRGVTFLEGAAGIPALRATLAAAFGDREAAAAAAARVEALETAAMRLPPDDCELLYGRAGYLHACLVARAAAGAAAVPDAVLSRTADAILAAGAAAADARGADFAARWGLLYSWHGTAYLGGAHGLAGIVLTLLQTEAALRAAGSTWRISDPGRVRAATRALAASLLPSGNLPSRLGREDSNDRLVQWCHGAPGFLLLAAAAAQLGGNAGVTAAELARPAAAAAECVWCVSMQKW